jgi:hypothetical protein
VNSLYQAIISSFGFFLIFFRVLESINLESVWEYGSSCLFTQKCIKMIFFYFFKIIFYISASKWSKITKKILIFNKKIKKFIFFQKRFWNVKTNRVLNERNRLERKLRLISITTAQIVLDPWIHFKPNPWNL